LRKQKRFKTKEKSVPVLLNGTRIGTVISLNYEEQYPHDMLYHPSTAIKRLEKMIVDDDFNPSRRKQREYQEILDDTGDDLDNENDT
jgi:hypothetical protein